MYVTLKQKKLNKVENKAPRYQETLDSEYDEILSRLAQREATNELREDILVA